MIGAGELFLTKISESECFYENCESCVATEQFVGIVSTIIHKQERGKFL